VPAGEDDLAEENARLRRKLAEREAALREMKAIISRALPERRGKRYADPDDVVRRIHEARNANARQR
jgi:hypothetical protein